MKIKDIRKVILQFTPDNGKNATLEGKAITVKSDNIHEVLDIGKENLNMMFEEAKSMVNNDYHVSDFLRHDQIKYFETSNGDCYVIGFDINEDSISDGITLNFYQNTSIPELDILQNYTFLFKDPKTLLGQGVGA